MKKKLLSALLSVAMVATLLVGCGGTTATTEEAPATEEAAAEETAAEETADAAKQYEGVTLNFWSMWNSAEPQGQVIQAAADAFEAETGAKVNIEWKGRDIQQLIMAALEQGEAIDLFEDDYARIAKTYVEYCYDLTDMAAAANYADQSFACFNDVATAWAGFLPCVTEQPQVGGVFYNKDIFAECGVEVPTTWEEFMAVCQTLVDNGYQPLALDTAYARFNMGYHLERYLTEAGVSELIQNGGWAESEGAIQAAQDIIDFVNAGYLADGAPDEYPASQNKIGLTGEVAMVVCANYVAAEVNNNTGAEINWGMFNYPTVANGSDSTNAYAGANSIAVTSYSENAQAAFDFALFLTSGEFDQQMADTASQIPADPRNTAPAIMDGTIEALTATANPLSWNMGLNDNADVKEASNEIVIKLFEGAYATGADFAAAMDALY
ncbi:MAG: extracellular solute-binding protein [Lachnospiraceae bacterium]|nr:extracellular solute-binding protein [Lachnospiraceae bacterium]